MAIEEVIKNSKEFTTIIITGLGGSIAHIMNKHRKGEKMTFWEHIQHLFLSGFVGGMTWLVCSWLGISGPLLGIIIGMSSYGSIRILDVLDLITAKEIKNIILDYIRYKVGVQKQNKK